MKKLLFLLCGIVLFYATGVSQNQRLIDSLQNSRKQLERERLELRDGVVSIRDSSSVLILNKLSLAFTDNSSDKGLGYAKQALALSEQIGWKKGVAKSYFSLGRFYNTQDNFAEALKYFDLALKLSEQLEDKKAIARCYSSIGLVYNDLGNFPEAMKYYYSGLKISEEIGDKQVIAMNYINMGIVYHDMKNYPDALKSYSAALKLFEALGDKRGVAMAVGNMGGIYNDQGNRSEALKHHFKSLKIKEEAGNKKGISASYHNIGCVYEDMGNYKEALKYYDSSLKIKEELGIKTGVALNLSSLGEIYMKLNQVSIGRKYLERGLSISKKTGSREFSMICYGKLARADSCLGNFESSFSNYKMYILYRDSLLNNENTKKITQQQMQYEFDKKEALTKAEQEKKDALALEEIENQKLVRNGFMGGFATVIIFAGTFFRQRNKIKLEKKRSDQLLRNILPDEIAEELKETGSTKAKTHEMVSVMFTDFKDFTKISESISAEMLVEELHTCFSAFDNILLKHNIEKIKTIGDAYMCVSGAPVHNQNHATDIVKAAIEIMEYVKLRKKEKDARGEFSFELRIGINSGPVVAGIVGLEKFSYDIWGDTVNTAARMEKQGEAGKINISGTTYGLVKNEFSCVHRGKITAKNKGEIDMYFVS